MELHTSLDQLRAEGIELFAVSYDDVDAIAAYQEASGVEFTLLSDVDSAVIREYGVLNTLVGPDDVPFFGIPFPGFFLVDEDGVIVDKLFNRHLANREGVEQIVDSFLGRVEPGDNDPAASLTEEDGIELTAFVRGGGGVLRIGPRRRLVVRFEMPAGLHIYDEPVPTGMVSTQVTVSGPEGLHFEPVETASTAPLELPGIDAPLQVWSGTVDFVVPFYADSSLSTRFDESDEPSVELSVQVRYQSCDDAQCFIPTTRVITLEIPMRISPMPAFDVMQGYGGETIEMDSEAHLRRLVERKIDRGSSTD